MAELNKYLDYEGLVKVIELIHSNFPTKAITAEALDVVNQCLTELIEKYNEHTHSLENSKLNVSYSNGKLTINSSHNHTIDTISSDHLQTPPPALPESLMPEGWTPPTPSIDYSKEYFTLHMLADGNMTLYVPSSYTTAPSYSANGGEWTTFTSETTISLKSDDKVRVKCTAGAYQRGSNSTMFNGTGEYEVCGNTMSLLYGDGFKGQTTLTEQYSFRSLFYNQTTLKNSENLILPATTLASGCYSTMFEGCTSLTSAPSVLPATTLTGFCYQYMFNRCVSLTTAPELPATKLVTCCYSDMFNGCTSLTSAPELPATKLMTYCYDSMFNGCSKLNKIVMLATDINASNCLTNWVFGVASSGTFIKHPNMTFLSTGVSGIPSGWIVQDYQG